MSKSQKSVLITGCSSGIGRALALEFHSRGFHVFATARSLSSIQDLADMGMTSLELDVTNNDAVIRARDRVAELTGGKLDVLVNNAGQSFLAAASDVDMDQVQALYDANVFGPMRMVKAYVPLLIASGDARIIQIGSVAAIAPLPFGSAYNGTKGALHAYGNTIRIELAPFGIKVINACTGKVKSDISSHRQITGLPDGSIYKPIEDIFMEKRVGVSQRGALAAEDYAKQVVSSSLKNNPPSWIWAGSETWLIWFVDTFLLRTVFDRILSGLFGLDKLAVLVKGVKAKIV
jgi:1-acylglycerone phosphate reductase